MSPEAFDRATDDALQEILDRLDELVAQAADPADMIVEARIDGAGSSRALVKRSAEFIDRFNATIIARLGELRASGAIPILFVGRDDAGGDLVQVGQAHYIPGGLSGGPGGDA